MTERPNICYIFEKLSVMTFPCHTDPELQVIVQGLEVGSPWFHEIFGVLFCDYDESQGLLG